MNRMCFLLVNPSEEIVAEMTHFDFVLPPQASLKIHDSVYSMVESSHPSKIWPEVLPDDLTVHFLPERFNGSSAAREHFEGVVKNLATYNATAFETFFFTSPAAAQFFASSQDGSETFQGDKRRHEQWVSIVGHFKQSIATEPTADPCGFRNLLATDVMPQQVNRTAKLLSVCALS